MSRNNLLLMSFVIKMKREIRCDFCANYMGELFCTNAIARDTPRSERLCDGNLSSRPDFCPMVQVAIQRDMQYVEIKEDEPR
jgi:hypothetical protein